MLLEEMLRALEAGVQAQNAAPETRVWFLPVAERLRRHVGWDRIAVARDGALYSYHYFTFAGRLMNSVIAQWAGLASYEADDIMLRSDAPIDFAQLPCDPGELQAFAARILQMPDDLTIFQNALPSRLLAQELVDTWTKTPVFGRSLVRLHSAQQHLVPMAELAALCV